MFNWFEIILDLKFKLPWSPMKPLTFPQIIFQSSASSLYSFIFSNTSCATSQDFSVSVSIIPMQQGSPVSLTITMAIQWSRLRLLHIGFKLLSDWENFNNAEKNLYQLYNFKPYTCAVCA